MVARASSGVSCGGRLPLVVASLGRRPDPMRQEAPAKPGSISEGQLVVRLQGFVCGTALWKAGEPQEGGASPAAAQDKAPYLGCAEGIFVQRIWEERSLLGQG